LTCTAPSLLQFLFSYIAFDCETDCWDWFGDLNWEGYGVFYLNGCAVLAHRIAYELFEGEIPSNLELHHSCERTWCCNPAHLQPVTRLQHRQVHQK
jgi:hypothetical protein